MDKKTARAAGRLAARNKRTAEICEAVGMNEHAADARNRQADMVDDLHEAAAAENRNRGR